MELPPGQGWPRNVTRELRDVARGHRTAMTQAENDLWQEIRQKKLDGLRFRRQHAVGTFIFDFYCPASRLVVEVDGAIHADPNVAERDRLRQEHIERYGLTVLRLQNEEIHRDLPRALERIRNAARSIAQRQE